jgi:two-component system LytT family response regulator
MKYLIIEDEPQAVKVIQTYVSKHFPDFSCLGDFDKISDAAAFLKTNPVDFVFLDVQLNGELGIDIGKFLSKDELNFEIIFTTAYSGFAIEAFSLCAIDYLLKPLVEDRFVEAVSRVLKKGIVTTEQLELLEQMSKVEKIEKIILRNHEGQYPVLLEDILFLKADNVYTEFHLLNRKRIVVSKPLKEYDSLLSQEHFFKAHRSYIMNTLHIQQINQLEATMKDKTILPISRDKKKELEMFLR